MMGRHLVALLLMALVQPSSGFVTVRCPPRLNKFMVSSGIVDQSSVRRRLIACHMSTRDEEQNERERPVATDLPTMLREKGLIPKKLPPMQVDDLNLLLYDLFLIINLVASVSFWVVHRLDLKYMGLAFNEGCLMGLLWIVSGLFSGAFLHSAVDGHYPAGHERSGPIGAGLLAFATFLNTVNLRLAFAFVVAVAEHRQVGMYGTEQLIPLEVGFGFILMSLWRMLHSTTVARL